MIIDGKCYERARPSSHKNFHIIPVKNICIYTFFGLKINISNMYNDNLDTNMTDSFAQYLSNKVDISIIC